MSFGKLSVNINGDLGYEEIVWRARAFEKAGVKVVWIGEFEGFEDPFKVAEVLASETSLLIGFGILSPLRRECREIERKVDELRRKFGDRFYVALAPGNEFGDARSAVNKTVECMKVMGDVFAGVSSPLITKLASKYSSGLLINYVNPEFVRWIKGFSTEKIFTASYGPSLILPSEFEEDLLIAASIVFLSSKKFISTFGFDSIASEIRKVNIAKLIEVRKRGESIKNYAPPIFKYRDFLLENFTISGSYEEVLEKVKELLGVVDHVILADPFFRDRNSIKFLKEMIEECEKS